MASKKLDIHDLPPLTSHADAPFARVDAQARNPHVKRQVQKKPSRSRSPIRGDGYHTHRGWRSTGETYDPSALRKANERLTELEEKISRSGDDEKLLPGDDKKLLGVLKAFIENPIKASKRNPHEEFEYISRMNTLVPPKYASRRPSPYAFKKYPIKHRLSFRRRRGRGDGEVVPIASQRRPIPGRANPGYLQPAPMVTKPWKSDDRVTRGGRANPFWQTHY